MAIINLEKNKLYHLIGIGGTGMSALAKALLDEGLSVSGSDIKENIYTIKLKDLGAKIFIGHHKKNCQHADYIIQSSAINPNNAEIIKAKDDGKTIYHRRDLLNTFIQKYKKSICITGTHGKTTTSAMLVLTLEACLKTCPTFIIGSTLKNYNTNSYLGDTDYAVFESDESDGSFAHFHPYITIITNLEAEHLEFFNDEKNLFKQFSNHIHNLLAKDKYVIYNQDCPHLNKICQDINHQKCLPFSLKNHLPLTLHHSSSNAKGTSSLLKHNHQDIQLNLALFGRQNIENAFAVLQVIKLENLSLSWACKSLAKYEGTQRRSEWIGNVQTIDIYDDYAHHPKEIFCTLKGFKESFKKHITCIFQPHRYSRTRDFYDDFPPAFEFADTIIITEIFSANEAPIPNINGQDLSKKIKKHWPQKDVLFFKNKSLIAAEKDKFLKNNMLIITMGAGNINHIGREMLHQLKQ